MQSGETKTQHSSLPSEAAGISVSLINKERLYVASKVIAGQMQEHSEGICSVQTSNIK